MKFRYEFLLGVVAFITACTEPQVTDESNQLDTIILDAPPPAHEATPSNIEAELEALLENSTINKYYKDVYKKGAFINNEKMVLSINDSLFSENNSTKLFYFIVFSKALNGAEGVFSEMAMQSAFDYVRDEPEVFAQNFLDALSLLNDKDFMNWGNNVYFTLEASSDGHISQDVASYEQNLLQKTTSLNEAQQGIIRKFLVNVKDNIPRN